MSETIKVLMVDDEEQFRETTKKLLKRRGFETLLAGSGEEAIDKLKENPDVVVLDIKMPGMDGHQALKEIKRHSPDLPVIMLTGHGARPSAREALVEGAFDYLSKPCDMDLLGSKISEAYRHGRRAEPPEEKNVAQIYIEKHRNGPTGKVDLFFDEQKVSFKNLEKRIEPPYESASQPQTPRGQVPPPPSGPPQQAAPPKTAPEVEKVKEEALGGDNDQEEINPEF